MFKFYLDGSLRGSFDTLHDAIVSVFKEIPCGSGCDIADIGIEVIKYPCGFDHVFCGRHYVCRLEA